MSIENYSTSGSNKINLVWRTLAGQNPYSFEIKSRKGGQPEDIEISSDESSVITITGKEDSTFEKIKISFTDPKTTNSCFIQIFKEIIAKLTE